MVITSALWTSFFITIILYGTVTHDGSLDYMEYRRDFFFFPCPFFTPYSLLGQVLFLGLQFQFGRSKAAARVAVRPSVLVTVKLITVDRGPELHVMGALYILFLYCCTYVICMCLCMFAGMSFYTILSF